MREDSKYVNGRARAGEKKRKEAKKLEIMDSVRVRTRCPRCTVKRKNRPIMREMANRIHFQETGAKNAAYLGKTDRKPKNIEQNERNTKKFSAPKKFPESRSSVLMSD